MSSNRSDNIALIQERMSLFFKVLFSINAGLTVLILVIQATFVTDDPLQWSTPTLVVGTPLVGFLIVKRLTNETYLWWLEMGVCFIYFFVYTDRILTLSEPVPAALAMMCAMILTFRASVIPSAPLKTAIVGVLCTLIVAFGMHHYDVTNLTLPIFIWTIATLLAFVVVTTVTSKVIYGLYARAAKAEQLGQYTIERKIGEGGMGTVFLARHAMLQRQTALKILNDDGLQSRVAIERFREEVQITSKLTHPNTINIYDYGVTPQGLFFYAMDYLTGATLREVVLKTGPMEPARAVHILIEVLGAIDEAHTKGVLHRDIKPSNIMLCERGGIKDTAIVLDFGLVASIGSSSVGEDNELVGTPAYMAPESILEPKYADPRTDIYAIGGLAYYLLCGAPPFVSDDVVELLCQTIEDTPVSLRVHEPSIPESLETIVLQCLSKDPQDRPNSAAEVSYALQALALDWTIPERDSWWAAYDEVVVDLSSVERADSSRTNLSFGKIR